MKQIVVNEWLDEMRVHPQDVYRRLVSTSVASAKELLKQRAVFVERECPACTSSSRSLAFTKHDYTYWLCSRCYSLFISPIPPDDLLGWYLRDSPAAAFRKGKQFTEAMDVRMRELATYRAEWISELCGEIKPKEERPVVVVEDRWPVLLEELSSRLDVPLIAAHHLSSPSKATAAELGAIAQISDCRNLRGLDAQLVGMFDILEHEASPQTLVRGAYDALAPGGLLIATTRSGSGFDIQVLWEKCDTIFPVEHMNLISVEGMCLLLTGNGFEIVELSTPGQLDVQMVERSLEEEEEVCLPRFLMYFFGNRDTYAKRRLQEFLQENLLSSHLRIVARKTRESTGGVSDEASTD